MEVGFYDTPGNAMGVAVAGNYAYVAAYSAGLRIVDIQNPAQPFEVGACHASDAASDVAVIGDYAFEADWADGFRVVDVHDPTNPFMVAFQPTPGYACGIVAQDNHIYVAELDAGLYVLDAQNPLNPVIVGFYDTPGNCWGVAVSGDYAYVADDSYFEILDCSQAAPVSNHSRPAFPVSFSLSPAYPNPFNPITRLAFDLPIASQVNLSVYDILGRRIATLCNGLYNSGTHQVIFNGSHLSSGVYFYRLQAGEFGAVKKMVLTK